MNLGILAQLLSMRIDQKFRYLKVTVVSHGDQKILMEGNIESFIEKVYFCELDEGLKVCEILRDYDTEYEKLPVYLKPMVITVV